MKLYLKKSNLLIVFILFVVAGNSQELFSVTEPASNRAARSIGFRVDNTIMDEVNSSRINYHMIPEIMVGISKKLMVNANTFFSNRNDIFKYEGAGIYVKYRFLSKDALQQHFRMAAFGRVSYNNSDIHQDEIDLYGHNTGAEVGLVATQLLRKVAVSSSVSFLNASDNSNNNKFQYGMKERKAANYTLSIGKLMMPKEYRDYRQTNINLMVEFSSQLNLGSGNYYMDIAPSIQMILNSQSRIDLGYRKELKTTLLRTAPNGFFIRLEHNLFNAF